MGQLKNIFIIFSYLTHIYYTIGDNIFIESKISNK